MNLIYTRLGEEMARNFALNKTIELLNDATGSHVDLRSELEIPLLYAVLTCTNMNSLNLPTFGRLIFYHIFLGSLLLARESIIAASRLLDIK